MEKRLLDGQVGEPSPAGEPAELWLEVKQDRDLNKLFHMRPYFQELTLEELERYLKMSPIMEETAEPAAQPPVLPAIVPPEYKPLEIAITNTISGQDGTYSVSLGAAFRPIAGRESYQRGHG